MKYMLLLTLIACSSSEPVKCVLIKRKTVDKSLVLIYSCNGELICRTMGDKSVDCTEYFGDDE